MTDSDVFETSSGQERLSEILTKIVTHQHSLPDGRAVELEELERESILSPDDLAFLTAHSVTYKPHRRRFLWSGDLYEGSRATTDFHLIARIDLEKLALELVALGALTSAITAGIGSCCRSDKQS
jgi:hypothetical protein